MAFKHVNKGVKRVDAYEKVTGKAKFGADLEFANMLQAKVLRTEYHLLSQVIKPIQQYLKRKQCQLHFDLLQLFQSKYNQNQKHPLIL